MTTKMDPDYQPAPTAARLRLGQARFPSAEAQSRAASPPQWRRELCSWGPLLDAPLFSAPAAMAVPGPPDIDNDGLDDSLERRATFSDPNKADTDSDGLSDGREDFETSTSPTRADTDGDRLHDPDELRMGLDPLNPDTDGDGVNDGQESLFDRTNPRVPNNAPAPAPAPAPEARPDTDGEGLFDDDETNVYHTNPNKSDTDFDGRDDGQEVFDGTNPRIFSL